MSRLHWIAADDPVDAFPPADQALTDPPGLLAGGGDLSPARLRAAYRRGIFPWYSAGQPVLWWSPDPREVLWPDKVHRSHSLLKLERQAPYEICCNRAFSQIIEHCAQPNTQRDRKDTWITPQMQASYRQLHAEGDALSVEVWAAEVLVGGFYGVRTGRVFSGESMFSEVPNASKLALSWWARQCPALGIELIDCQMPSAHLRSLGSEAMPRKHFLQFLSLQ